jgi:hypothetical protein
MAGDKYVMWFGLAVIVIVVTWVVVTVFSVLLPLPTARCWTHSETKRD